MIKTERKGPVTTLLLDRADKRNAIDWDMVHALAAGVAAAEKDTDCRCLVVKGAGDHFAAGRDLGATKTQRTLETVLADDDAWTEIFQGLRRMTKPSVAVVRGYAVAGGFTLAMGCDFVLAEKGARFGAFEMRHGFPAAVCTPILARVAAPRIGLELALFGEEVTAERLFAAGLINRLAENAADLASLESEFVGHLASLDPRAVKFTRDTFRAAESMPLDNALDMGRQLNQLIAATGGFAKAGQKLSRKP